MAQQSATWPVLKAVAAALNVAGFTGAIAGKTVTVTNDPSQALGTPFTVITVASETRLDAMQQAGKDVLVELHHFSDYAGDLEVATMRSAALALLHYGTLTVANHTFVECQFQDGLDLGSDEIIGQKRRHYVDLYRVLVKQAA